MTLILFLVLLFSGVLRSLVAAWATTKVWGWYTADAVGVSPGLWAWFGIFAVVNIVVQLHAKPSAASKDRTRDRAELPGMIGDGIGTAAASCAGIAIGVLMLWILGRLAGVIA